MTRDRIATGKDDGHAIGGELGKVHIYVTICQGNSRVGARPDPESRRTPCSHHATEDIRPDSAGQPERWPGRYDWSQGELNCLLNLLDQLCLRTWKSACPYKRVSPDASVSSLSAASMQSRGRRPVVSHPGSKYKVWLGRRKPPMWSSFSASLSSFFDLDC